MNLTKKWMLASLLAATSVFAQNNKDNCRPAPKPPEPMPAPATAAYNAPAGVDVRGCWDLYATASFIYWQPVQDNMEVGMATSEASGGDGIAAVSPSNNIVNLSSSYKPGFQVGLGMNFDWDNWDSYLQYTWFHNSHSTSSNGPSGGSVLAMRISPAVGSVSDSFDSISENWNLKMDLADWQFGRGYYVGTKLTFRPYFGLRAAWIRQRLNETLTAAAGPNTVTYAQKSTSWGLGPETGLTANFMFDYGLRMFGDVMGDLIYTRYSTSTHQNGNDDGTVTDFKVRQKSINTVRAHTSMDLGFGWGTYFDNNNWHFDLAASYGFQAFFDQNMFRNYVDDTLVSLSNSPNGNLYVHGLNITARLDF